MDEPIDVICEAVLRAFVPLLNLEEDMLNVSSTKKVPPLPIQSTNSSMLESNGNTSMCHKSKNDTIIKNLTVGGMLPYTPRSK
jgi:hypothetical protein